MTDRNFFCKKCNVNFNFNVGSINFNGLLPKMEKNAICPNCGTKITTSKLLADSLMDTINVSSDVVFAVSRLSMARSWEERRKIIEEYPLLLTKEAEDILKSNIKIVKSIGNPEELKGDQQLLWLVKSCRKIGIEKTFNEL